MTWWVHRNDGAVIVFAAQYEQAGYAEEQLEDDNAELLAFLNAPGPVPQTASSGDFMRALYDLGWYDAAKAAVASVGGLAQILWDRAAIFERQHPMVAQIATAIGKTSDDLDNLFRKTATYVGDAA
jgi:hypothetical protein